MNKQWNDRLAAEIKCHLEQTGRERWIRFEEYSGTLGDICEACERAGLTIVWRGFESLVVRA